MHDMVRFSCPDIFASGAIIAGVNMLLLAGAGIKSGVFDQFISKVEVDKDIASDLETQSSTDFVPMFHSTYHLTCWNSFKSRWNHLLMVYMNLPGEKCQRKFVKRACENDELPFCTTDQDLG